VSKAGEQLLRAGMCAGFPAGLADGRIRHREDVTEGLENAPAAFMGLLQGRNFGKALVRVAH